MADDSRQTKKSTTSGWGRSAQSGLVDTHPLVREYYGEQLRGQRSDAWKECNKRLFNYYRTLAPQLPVYFCGDGATFLSSNLRLQRRSVSRGAA